MVFLIKESHFFQRRVLIILRLQHYINKEIDKLIYIFNTLCQFFLNQMLSEGSDKVYTKQDKVNKLKNIHANFDNLKKIFDFIYLIEILCSTTMSGKLNIETLSMTEFEQLDTLIQMTQDCLNKAEKKVHSNFSSIKLLYRLIKFIKKEVTSK